MSEDLTTRDVFQQLDTRVGRMETDLRDFRAEVNSRLDRLFGVLVSLMVGIGALVLGVAGLWLKA